MATRASGLIRPKGRRRAIADLRIATAGHEPKKRATLDRGFDATGIGLVVRGRGTYRVNAGPAQRVRAPCVFPVYPGQRFRSGPFPGESWDEHYVCVVGDGGHQWRRWGLLPTDGRVCPVADPEATAALFRESHALRKRVGPGDAHWALVVTERLLVEIFHGLEEGEQRRVPDHAVEAALAYGERPYDQPIGFHALSREQAVSYSTLRQPFRRATGLPPGQYWTRLRCDGACRLLEEPALPVSEVGDCVWSPLRSIRWSPRWSPWSEVKTTIVFSRRPSASSRGVWIAGLPFAPRA